MYALVVKVAEPAAHGLELLAARGLIDGRGDFGRLERIPPAFGSGFPLRRNGTGKEEPPSQWRQGGMTSTSKKLRNMKNGSGGPAGAAILVAAAHVIEPVARPFATAAKDTGS